MIHHYQETDVTCGPAALRMLLARLGHDVPEATLADALGTDANGTHADRFEAVLAARGHTATVWHGDVVLRDLRDILDGHHVMVCYQSPTLRTGHFALVADLADDHVELDDPWFGPCTCIPVDDFLEQWRSEPHQAKVRPRWLLAVPE